MISLTNYKKRILLLRYGFGGLCARNPVKPEPLLGDYLGDLTDELDGDYITTFISGGPKNYAYLTNNGKSVYEKYVVLP